MRLEYLIDGISSLLFVIISLIIGLYITSKYFKHRNKEFLLVGIAWMGLILGYIPTVMAFLYYLIWGIYLDLFLYLLFYGVIPLTMILWIIAIRNILNVENKFLFIFSIIICLLLSISYYTLLFINPHLIGIFLRPFYIEFTIFTRLFFISLFLIFSVTGFGLVLQCLRSDNKEIRLKGKHLLVAFILFIISGVMTSNIDVLYLKIVARIIIVISSIEFYIGYILPDWAKKLFLKEE